MKLHDSQLRIMDVLWTEKEASATRIVAVLKEKYNYSKTTTYTLIKRCIDKNAIERIEPGFICRPLVSLEETQMCATTELINKLYNGSADMLFASLLGSDKLTTEQIENLKKVVNSWGEKE